MNNAEVRSLDWVAKKSKISGAYASRLLATLKREKNENPSSLEAKILMFNLKRYQVN